MHELQANGIAVAIVDALNDEDLGKLGEALRNSPFLTAGSGLGNSLPRNWGFRPRKPGRPAAGAGAKGHSRRQLLSSNQYPGTALHS